ncbi:hypothetical protein BT96DRAFT_440272 [Gymnopus androsaceus JB14]|uniref:Uncharacterized protein n=1 Tax=Gymnopus androsaceus JB14 TaxID=1447944 RepID=A0A6A4I5R7_9AGAR|nr:hypothetical protein BT96DRAFT_440272 [Gymnopus androsaceus JB14]
MILVLGYLTCLLGFDVNSWLLVVGCERLNGGSEKYCLDRRLLVCSSIFIPALLNTDASVFNATAEYYVLGFSL